MTAAIVDRDTRSRTGQVRNFPLAAAALLYAGVMAVLSAGYLTKGVTGTGLVCVGVTRSRLDNSTGIAGAVNGDVERGVFGPFANSAAADQITNADIGAVCYIVDDSTVAKISATSTRSVAGNVFEVTTAGVWVDFK